MAMFNMRLHRTGSLISFKALLNCHLVSGFRHIMKQMVINGKEYNARVNDADMAIFNRQFNESVADNKLSGRRLCGYIQ